MDLSSKGTLDDLSVSKQLSQLDGTKVALSRKRENILSHDTMMNMLRGLFRYVNAPGEIRLRRAEFIFLGHRRFLDVDVQGLDGTWFRRRLYIRAQPSREIFKCDIPFHEKRKEELAGSPGHFNKRARERSRRRPVLIAPLIRSSARAIMIDRGFEAWRCYVVWKPRLRTQGNRTKCEISLDWLKTYRDLAKVVRWFLQVVAAKIRRARWGTPRPQREKAPSVKLISFMRPEPWPPPGG